MKIALAILILLCAGPPRPDRPNVLLISIDDLNDWTGSLGGHPQARTPSIDRLAGRGMLFANAHCQSPVCTPSRASLLTSAYPSTTGLYFLRPGLDRSPVASKRITLFERFAKEGYRTVGVGKIYGGGDGRHFQEYGGGMGGFGPRPKEKINYPAGHPLWDWGHESEPEPETILAAAWEAARVDGPPLCWDTFNLDRRQVFVRERIVRQARSL